MKHLKLVSFITGFVFIVFGSCSKKDNNDPVEGNVELYLIESYSTVDNTMEIDETSIITKQQPLINYSDILSYDADEYMFTISENAKSTIQSINVPVSGMPFALKANNEIIYTGYFWPSFSSTSCFWVVIDPIQLILGNELKVELGYPGLLEGQTIPDKRNDQRILAIFNRDGKLN